MPRAEALSGHPAKSAPALRGSSSIESAKALAFLARLAMEVTTVLSLPDLLEHVMRVLREETGFDSCGLLLRTKRDTEDVLVMRAASGLQAIKKGAVFPRGQGIGWVVMESGAPLIVPDAEADPRLILRYPGFRSGIFAPLVVQMRPIGVLSAWRATVDGFTGADLNLLTIVARYLAGAVEVAQLHEELKELAATDALTGLANRRAFLDRLAEELARSERAGSEFAIVLLDLDGFKIVNDVYGHAVGDRVLMRVAEMLNSILRASDVAARLGGDEFVLLLPESTGAQALEIIDRLRAVELLVPSGEGRAHVGFSWGIATWPQDGDTGHLLQEADRRLYSMKRSAPRLVRPSNSPLHP